MKRLFILFSFLLLAIPTIACDCDGPEKPLQESMQKAHAVFVGKVLSIKEYKPSVKPQGQWDRYYLVEFEAEEIFKGATTKTIKLIEEGSSCGLDVLKGQTYLVFTYFDEQEKMPVYHQCFKPASLKEHASEELTILRGSRQ